MLGPACHRVALAVSLAALAVGALSAIPNAAAEPYIPGWRSFTAASELHGTGPPGTDPNVLLVSHRGGRAGIDQIVASPPPSFKIKVRGTVLSGRGQLDLEWTDATGAIVAAESRSLQLNSGITELPFESPPTAETLRIAVSQQDGDSVLELASIELVDTTQARLINEQLLLSGCPADNSSPSAPYGTDQLPGWQLVGDDAWLHLERRTPSADFDVRLLATSGSARLVQYVRANAEPVVVHIAGAGSGTLVAEWREGGQDGRVLIDRAYRIDLSKGERRVQIASPETPGSFTLGVGIVRDPGSQLLLSRVTAIAGSDQLLVNPELAVPACPAAATAPPSADTLAPVARWTATGVLIALGALLLAFVVRRVHKSAGRQGLPRVGRGLWIALLVGVALTPLVSIGTVKLSIRLIPSDWIFLGVAIVALTIPSLRSAAVSDSSRALALASTLGLTVVVGASLIAALTLWTEPNLAALPLADTLVENIGSPGLRGAIEELRLVQGLACLFAILALVHTRRSWLTVATTIAVSAAVVSVYGLYQVGGEILLGSVPQPPWAYQTDGLRAGGTFPEPTAFAGFLVFGAGCAACVLELRRRTSMAVVLLLIISGIVASRSTVGLVGLGVLAVALICSLRLRAATVILVAALALGGLGLAFRDDARVREAYAKPFGVSESVLDREAVWGAALRMGAAYAPAGVGRGQFAYNQAPFVDPSQADRGGRANSAILELWSEAGPVGIFFALSALVVGPILLLRRREQDRFRILHGEDGGLLVAQSRAPAVPWASRMVIWALFLSLLAVLALYYTTSFIWIWLAIGLLATAPTALRDRGIPFPEPVLTEDPDALAANGGGNGQASTASSRLVASGSGDR